jgi:hypothetical protein
VPRNRQPAARRRDANDEGLCTRSCRLHRRHLWQAEIDGAISEPKLADAFVRNPISQAERGFGAPGALHVAYQQQIRLCKLVNGHAERERLSDNSAIIPAVPERAQTIRAKERFRLANVIPRVPQRRLAVAAV